MVGVAWRGVAWDGVDGCGVAWEGWGLGRISSPDLHGDDIITTFMREMNMLERTEESYTAINTPRTPGHRGSHFPAR
ncbi:hypothetical protein E2C01_018036 [Portunus trituberculatus]|uniref:Uncharacterized protein n=1 Tax=Portunus trituberculatus TaxID=210409 RepID=A0A5B7DTG5_PORTR|nr:hypothetical protein [Portunus trituberculatus]